MRPKITNKYFNFYYIFTYIKNTKKYIHKKKNMLSRNKNIYTFVFWSKISLIHSKYLSIKYCVIRKYYKVSLQNLIHIYIHISVYKRTSKLFNLNINQMQPKQAIFSLNILCKNQVISGNSLKALVTQSIITNNILKVLIHIFLILNGFN